MTEGTYVWQTMTFSAIDRRGERLAGARVTAHGAVVTFNLREGTRWELSGGITVTPEGDDCDLSALNLGAILDQAREYVVIAARDWDTPATLDVSPENLDAILRNLLKPWRKTGQAREEADYARIAIAYWLAAREGHRPGPTIARLTGMSPRTASGTVAEARRRGLLTRVAKGSTGGRPTDRAWKLVDLPD